jgi:anti-anti-sigma factor
MSRHVHRSVIVKIRGKFYSGAAVAAEESFAGALGETVPRVVIDPTELDYTSGAGLRVFLKLAKQVQRVSGNMALFGLHPNVREVFSITALDSILAICDDRAAAIALVQ